MQRSEEESSNLPDSLKSVVNRSLSAYCRQVITQEWTFRESHSAGHPSAIPALRHLLLTTEPANNLQSAVLKMMDEDLSAVTGLRRDRLSHARSQLPPLVWIVLFAGAALLVVFCYFFSTTSLTLQRTYLSFFVCLLSMCLSIVYSLDHPFAPGSGIDNGPYKSVLAERPPYCAVQKISAFALLPSPAA